MTSNEAYNTLLKAWQGNKESKDYPNFDDINEALNTIKQNLEHLEMELRNKDNYIKIIDTLHKSQIKNYLRKENKLLKELLISKQQISILKKALPYYSTKVLCNAGRITEEEQEILLKYEE